MRQGTGLVTWQLVYTKQAQKFASAGLKDKAKALMEVVRENPLQNPPPYEKLVGDLAGTYSRRISIQLILTYKVLQDEQTVKVLRLWPHYE
jgi:Txe/YoeB family toxin of toxin-antitoxin system